MGKSVTGTQHADNSELDVTASMAPDNGSEHRRSTARADTGDREAVLDGVPALLEEEEEDEDVRIEGMPEGSSQVAGGIQDKQEGSSLSDTTSNLKYKKVKGVGLLKKLSDACRAITRENTHLMFLSFVYDNINIAFKVAEQILGRKDTLENGTCATAFPLFEASEDAMKTANLLSAFDMAPKLSLGNILLTQEENQYLRTSMKQTVLRLLVTQGSHLFGQFLKNVDVHAPISKFKIPVHKTEIYPLPAMDIDESSRTGNADVLEAILREVGYDMTSESEFSTVRIWWGDQLSVACLCSVSNVRAGHDSRIYSLLNAVFAPGLFHYQMVAVGAAFESHWGSPQSWTQNPGSLYFHNTVLDRKPIVVTSPPPYRTCRDLIFVSLYARVFHCLRLVAGCESLEEYSKLVTFDELSCHAEEIVDQFANPSLVSDLRNLRQQEVKDSAETAAVSIDATSNLLDVLMGPAPSPAPVTEGDMILENAMLFLQDAILLRDFTDAIKTGDSERIVLILKVFALSFRGAGRTKYAHEMLHLIHNIEHVWPKDLRDVIMKNWLVNPTGKTNAFVPVDLMQEHNNFWIKVIYKAHGSSASWEWLAMVLPCIDILRKLSAQINTDLGSCQGSKHTSPDLWKDIEILMQSLEENQVYVLEKGRTITGSNAMVKNAVAAGLQALPGSLKEYNDFFRELQ
ncbi:hypothetical protein EW026_g8172 [Hermanssonia centrifuga]|uniref:DUF6589 domain-containing protein n=1 Tax=Hermanssonia centrifuga TaxID=98765 RepID=A0A4S4K9L4_9APHY|nr:hypothetical protein EW026_g8172 [Hermanssonia centrifuga]